MSVSRPFIEARLIQTVESDRSAEILYHSLASIHRFLQGSNDPSNPQSTTVDHTTMDGPTDAHSIDEVIDAPDTIVRSHATHHQVGRKTYNRRGKK